jgi:hypothetical protein
MSVITFPDICVSSFRWKLKRSEIAGRSSFGSQSLEVATPKWIVSMVGVIEYWEDAVKIEQFLEALAGYRNQTEVYHHAMPAPFGTLRGVLVLDVDHAAGATTLVVDGGVGQAGRTLLQGDLVGIGAGLTQQVIRVASDATADGAGVISIPLSVPLFNAFLAGESVRWDKPKALFRQMQDNNGIEYSPARVGQAWALDLFEDVRA